MIKNMKISVIMPFYNCEKYLDDSIWSILNQTFSDFEFIIINDASTDNSDEVVKRYISDPRIIYIKNEENKGIVVNLNYGLSIAKWEYIARMDGDDISTFDRFEKQIQFLEKNPEISILWSFVTIINENAEETGKMEKPISTDTIKRDLFLYLTIVHGTTMIRKEVYDKIWWYREEYLYTEDNDWTYRAIYSGFLWGNIPKFLYKYRKHTNSSYKNSKDITRKNFKLRKETIKNFKLKVWLKWYLSMYAHYILWMLLTGKQKAKLEYFFKKFLK